MAVYSPVIPNALQQSVLEISIANTINGKMSFTFTIASSNYQKKALSDLMVFFENKPDEIPLLIVAEGKNSTGEITSNAVFHGTSLLTDAEGTPVENIMSFPDKDNPKSPQAFLRILAPLAYISQVNFPKLSTPHYPFSNVVRFFPYVENAELGVGEEVVMIDNRKYVSVPDTSLAYGNFANTFSATLRPNYNIKLPPQNYLKAGSFITGGPVYLEYTYKGNPIRETEFSLTDFPIGNKVVPTSIIYYKIPSGAWNTSTSYSYHIQGKKNQQFKFEVTNTSPSSYVTSPNQASLPMVYKDVEITLEMPFELTLKDISYSTEPAYKGHPLLTDMKPKKVEYSTYGGETGTIFVSTDSSGFEIPAEVGHVKLLTLHYDLWVYNINNIYIITADIGTKTEANLPIPNDQTVYVKQGFSTKSGTLVEQYNTPNQMESPFPAVSRNHIVRLSEVADGLRFGTFSDTTDPTLKGNFYNSVRAYKEITTDPTSGTSLTNTDGKSPWKFGFKSVAKQSKDYDDVKIIIEANTDDEKKALSKMAGMQSSLTLNINMSQSEIFIKTNLVPEGKIIIPPRALLNTTFGLADGEYVTYLEVRLGTLIGTSFSQGLESYDSGEKIYPTSGYLQPTFSNDRYYFTGTDKQEEIRDGETFHLVARIETSSEAQYLEPNSNTYFNSTSTSTINFIPYTDIKFKRYESTYADWMGTSFYQGATFKFSFTSAIHYFLNGAEKPIGTYLEMDFPSYDHLIYLEVVEGFEITEIDGYKFVEKKALPATKTNLFIFETKSETHNTRISFTGYVRPDAPVGNDIEIFKNLGFDYKPFKDAYLMPENGADAYYNRAPYHKVGMVPNAFPAHWDAGGSADTQMFIAITSGTTVNINRANIDKIVLNALVGGVNKVTAAIFSDHQKTNLSVQGWLSNLSSSAIPSYRATFNLPRAGEQTQGGKLNGNDTFFSNQYSMCLTGPIIYPSSLKNPQVVYFAGDGSDLGQVPLDWREVTKVQITFDVFEPNISVAISLPLEADHNKIGLETTVIKAYVGAAASRKTVGDTDFSAEIYADPVLYDFASYILNLRTGIDSHEIGKLNTAVNSVGVTKIYYEENGKEKLLFTGQNGYNDVAVNRDVTRVEVTPNPGYKLSVQKAAGILDNQNSDFPRDTGSLPILIEDLMDKTYYKYDAALVYTPTLIAKDIVLREGGFTVTEPTIQTFSSAELSKYLKVFSVEDQSIATIEQDGTIAGIKVGTTAYTYTVTNLIGDKFAVTKNITVLKKAVPDTVFQKDLPDGPINAGDEFTFNIWSKADKSDLKTIKLSESLNSTTLGDFFLPGDKYFVEETIYDSAYTPKELTVIYTTSTGDVTETYPVTGATATFTVNSDADKMQMSFVNDSKRYSMKIEKALLPLNGNHDFAQEFPITVTDNKTDTIIFTSSLKGDGTQLNLSELVQNRSYTITEVKAGYKLISVEVVNALGSQAGITQPTKAGETSFVLTIDPTHEGATIVVNNEPLDKGNLRIIDAPNLDFGSIVNGTVQEVLRTEDVYYSIWDSRVEGGDWKLSLTASEMTTTLAGGVEHILPYNPLRHSKDGTEFVTLAPEMSVLIKKGATQKGVPTQTENWLTTETSGITFQSQNKYTYVGGYQSTLTWSLIAAP